MLCVIVQQIPRQISLPAPPVCGVIKAWRSSHDPLQDADHDGDRMDAQKIKLPFLIQPRLRLPLLV
jgi:hypothetical protein